MRLSCTKNEGSIDRLIRLFLAETIFILSFFWLSGVLSIILYIVSGILLVTALTGFCALYPLLHIHTTSYTAPRWVRITVFIFLIVAGVAGSYASAFITKKTFLEDYSRMNEYYKQTLFLTGQGSRDAAWENYQKLTDSFSTFRSTYKNYHPYALSGDTQFNADMNHIADIISSSKDLVQTGDLKVAHTNLEGIRPIFQEVFKRNGFSLFAMALVDFHDAMEVMIASADAQDASAVMRAYPSVHEKLSAIEAIENTPEIQAIRSRLEDVYQTAQSGQADMLPKKAADLKSSFISVYLKQG